MAQVVSLKMRRDQRGRARLDDILVEEEEQIGRGICRVPGEDVVPRGRPVCL